MRIKNLIAKVFSLVHLKVICSTYILLHGGETIGVIQIAEVNEPKNSEIHEPSGFCACHYEELNLNYFDKNYCANIDAEIKRILTYLSECDKNKVTSPSRQQEADGSIVKTLEGKGNNTSEPLLNSLSRETSDTNTTLLEEENNLNAQKLQTISLSEDFDSITSTPLEGENNLNAQKLQTISLSGENSSTTSTLLEEKGQDNLAAKKTTVSPKAVNPPMPPPLKCPPKPKKRSNTVISYSKKRKRNKIVKPKIEPNTMLFKEFIKIFEDIIEKELKKKDIKEINFKDMIETILKENNIEIDSRSLLYYIENISEEDNMYLHVIIHGYTSFFIRIKEDSLEVEESERPKALLYFILINQLSLLLKSVKIRTCARGSCKKVWFKPTYAFLSNLIHDVFIEIVKLYKFKTFAHYKLLILYERKFKCRHILHKNIKNFRFILNLTINSAFNIFFLLDEKTAKYLSTKQDLLENFFMTSTNSFDEHYFFLDFFCEQAHHKYINEFLNKYEKVITLFQEYYVPRSRMSKTTIATAITQIKKIYATKKNFFPVIINYVNGETLVRYHTSYGLFLCSTIIEMFKFSHGIHYNNNDFYVIQMRLSDFVESKKNER